MTPTISAAPLSPAGRTRPEIAGRTHIGLVRRRNEDSWGACERSGVLYVADGLGGHAAGDVASRIAGSCVLEAAAALRAGHRELGRQLFDSTVERAELLLQSYEADHPEAAGLGTTLTAVWRSEPCRIRVLHIGDSRAYLLRDGVLRPLTTDHSLVGEMVAAGRLSREQARVHPRSNIVTRCIGLHLPDEPGADIFDVDAKPGDLLLLATDGLTDLVPEARIEAICNAAPDTLTLLDALELASLEAGGRDNITIVAARLAAGQG
jgi:PPM family protein phosphatase